MNAAAKSLQQTTIFAGQLNTFRLSSTVCLHVSLVMAVLVSAIAVVYITNLHRIHYHEMQSSMQYEHQLQLEWGQLLLEQASLETPARVQQIAATKLNMKMPIQKHVITVRTP